MSRTGKLVVVAVVVLVLALGGGYLLLASRTSDSPPPAALDPAPSTTVGQATGSTQADGAATRTALAGRDDGRSLRLPITEQLSFLNAPRAVGGQLRQGTWSCRRTSMRS